MQMVERPWGAAAYGAASVKATPDLVRVRFKIIRLEKSPGESFARASGSVHAVREVLRGHGVPDGGVERSRLGPVVHIEDVDPSRSAPSGTAATAMAATHPRKTWRPGTWWSPPRLSSGSPSATADSAEVAP